MKKIILNILKFLFLGILLIATCLFIYNIIKLNVLNNLYIGIISIVLTLLLILIFFKLIRKKTSKISKTLFSILGIALIIIYFVGTTYISTTRNFIKKVTVKTEYRNYNIIVLKTSNYDKIKDLKNTNIGFLSDDLENNQKTLKKQITFETKQFDNTSYLTESLYNKETEAISIEQTYLDILTENDENYLNDKKIIYTYKVAISLENDQKELNIEKPFIIYISGSDARDKVSDVARSDVNIVVVVRPQDYKILMISTPRDYYVQLHGTTGTKDKLTHAGVYGINKSVTTMEDLLDIKIDRYIKVSFATVINSVDVIDGVDIYSEKAFTPRANKNCKIIEGTQHLNGECALAFARERKAYASGDRHRGENQEQVLTKIIEKVTTPKYLTKYNEILKAIDGSFETNATYEEITTLIQSQVSNPAAWQIETYNLDGASSMGPTYTQVNAANYTHIMIPYENTIETAKTKITEYLK
ncbi:MAG: LCP family protein [Bacilli bacterium]|nr:LCP family protein [Bacilli bacterium]